MSSTGYKFVFVGVMMALTMLVSRGSSTPQNAPQGEGVLGGPHSEPPLFVLTTPPAPFAEVSPEERKAFNASTLLTAGLTPLVGSGKNPVPPPTPPFVTSENTPSPVGATNVGDGGSVPTPQARVALVADLVSGENFFTLRHTERWPLASLTKLMTAVVALKELDLQKTVTFEEKDFVIENVRQYFNPGDQVTGNDLVRAMLIASSNEAAEALARSYGRQAFIAAMNAQAGVWGLTQTHFDDPTGLSAANQSTPRDLKVLVTLLLEEYPNIFETTQQPHWFILEQSRQVALSIGSTNAFAGRGDFLGGKTGYTNEAEGNLLSVFSYNNRPIVIIVMGTAQRFQETEKLLAWFKETQQ